MSLERQRLGYAGPGEGRSIAMPLGTLATLKVKAAQTGGAYSLFELDVAPGGGERPHIQHREDECLYVLSGEFEVVVEERPLRGTEGVTAYIPRGTLHGFENVGDGPGRLLAIHTPGDLHERFLERVGRPEGESLSPTLETEADLDRFVALGAEHGIEIVASPS